MSKHLERDLERLQKRIVGFATLVEEAAYKAVQALRDHDRPLAHEVIDGDEAIDRAENEIAEECLKLLALHQPVAGDLRRIATILMITTDLERMGDLARHVARAARRRFPDPAVPAPLRATVVEMGQVAELLVAKAGAVIASHDVEEALQVERDDDEMDRLHRELFTDLLDVTSPYSIEAAIDVTLVSRYYERFADHAVAVARRVVFLVTGQQPQDVAEHV